MAPFIQLTNVHCPQCGREVHAQSRTLSLNGIPLPLDYQTEQLRPGVEGAIWCECLDCDITAEMAIFGRVVYARP